MHRFYSLPLSYNRQQTVFFCFTDLPSISSKDPKTKNRTKYKISCSITESAVLATVTVQHQQKRCVFGRTQESGCELLLQLRKTPLLVVVTTQEDLNLIRKTAH
jgi:hypothetical protein